jgi:hypothetical protein
MATQKERDPPLRYRHGHSRKKFSASPLVVASIWVAKPFLMAQMFALPLPYDTLRRGRGDSVGKVVNADTDSIVAHVSEQFSYSFAQIFGDKIQNGTWRLDC